MIYTVTANPAVDYYVDMNTLPAEGEINRTENARMLPGGKGINVSIVLARLGISTCATGFCAGKTGVMLQTLLEEEGCGTDFILLKEGETRINTKIQYPGGETAFNGSGPAVTETDSQKLMMKLLNLLSEEDYLLLSGNLQDSIASFYQEILPKMQEKKIRTVVDTSGKALKSILGNQIFLAKPNLDELNELFGMEEKDAQGALSLAEKLQKTGVQNVLVSMGKDGAVLLTQNGDAFQAVSMDSSPVISTVGAGDSMIAGFLTGFLRTGDFEDALICGTAAGTGTALGEGLVTKEEFQRQYKLVKAERLSRA